MRGEDRGERARRARGRRETDMHIRYPPNLDTSEIGSRPPGGDDNRDQRGDRGSCTWKEERRREREVNLGLVENFQRDVDFFVSLATYF